MQDENTVKYTKHQSALAIYKKFENNQLQLSDMSRTDMHFKLKTGADILIEEHGIYDKSHKLVDIPIHGVNPFRFSVEDIAKWSEENNENIDVIISNYQSYYYDTVQRLENETLPTFKHYFGVDDNDANVLSNPDDILSYNKNRVQYLRMHDDSFDATSEIEHRRRNTFDILYFLHNKNIEDPMLKLYLDDFSLTNSVTVLQSVYETHENEKGEQTYSHKQRQYTIGECIELMRSPELNINAKETRPLVFPMTGGDRIVGDDAYLLWSGLQVFDIDLKFSSVFMQKYDGDASTCRDMLFDKLKHYPWLIGITRSASGRGLHVYTKVSRMHHIYKEDEANIQNQKYWYRMSYIQKHAAIAYVLDNICGITDIYDIKTVDGKKKEQVIDSSLARVSQGIAMNYDPNAKWNTNFIDLYPTLFYHVPPVKGIKLDEWLTLPKLINQYQSWFYENAINDDQNIEVQRHSGSLQIIAAKGSENLEGISQIDMNSLAKGDRYSTRWRICNTIMYAYAEQQEYGRSLCHHILQSSETKTVGTINSFIRSAVVNRKEADIYTIKQLRKLGVDLSVDDESTEEIADDAMSQTLYALKSSKYPFSLTTPNVNIELADDEYLGMRMEDMISAMKDYYVNIISSAPNTGKTEFFKSLARQGKVVCLVIPFTSTIESKIESDDSIKELFDVYYGDRSVRDIKKTGRSVVMTFDKFSTLPKHKYSLFDFIAIDESHLLFTSTYRLAVVSQTIENIRTYLLSDLKAERTSLSNVLSIQNMMSMVAPELKHTSSTTWRTKFILMTGTLTGEVDYFKHYGLLNYIKVHKKHPYKKEANIHLSKTSETRDVKLMMTIADWIKSGGKIIHPTNRGDTYAKQIVESVKDILGREPKWEYYKRANAEDKFLQDINNETTVNDTELLFCSDYLSVGIDIKDTDAFKLIFSNDFTAESIEQFNNRLRSTDIVCDIFYDVVDDTGLQKPNIINTNVIQYKHTDEMRHQIHDEQAIAFLEKSLSTRSTHHAILNGLMSKYFIRNHRGDIKYVQSAFEIEQFELQYTNIAKSLLYIATSLTDRFNYEINIDILDELDDDVIAYYKHITKEAKREFDIFKTESFKSCANTLGSPTTFKDLVQSNHIEFVKVPDDDKLIKDTSTGILISFDPDYKHGSFIVQYANSHKYKIKSAWSFVKYMRKLYSHATTMQIIDSCIKKRLIKKVELNRYKNLMKLIFVDRKNTLSQSTRSILDIAYRYASTEREVTIDRFDYEEMKADIRHKIMTDFSSLTDTTLNSVRRQDQVQRLVSEFVDTLFHKRLSQDSVKLSFRKIFKFNSAEVQNMITQDKIFHKILLNETYDDDTNTTNHMNVEHIDNTHIEETHVSVFT